MEAAEGIRQLQNSRHVEFSAISGYNFYRLPQREQPEGSVPALHGPSKTAVTLARVAEGSAADIARQLEAHLPFLYRPVSSPSFEWPLDLVESQRPDGRRVLYGVFPRRGFPGYAPIRQILYQRKDSPALDWRNPETTRLCRSLLTELAALDRAGYIYRDFNIDRILCEKQTGRVIFRYTPQIRQKGNLGGERDVDPRQIAVEFAPPYLFGREFQGSLPPQGDYYSTAAILFRLMIGRLPYEGRGLSSFGDVFEPTRDVDALQHQNYFQHYHQYPVFIFDETDDSNRLGPMEENDLPRERWEKLPQRLKAMFRQSLCRESAERLSTKRLYSPSQWLEACENCCWNKKEPEKRGTWMKWLERIRKPPKP